MVRSRTSRGPRDPPYPWCRHPHWAGSRRELPRCWWPATVPDSTVPPAPPRGGSWAERTVLPLSLRGHAAEVGGQECSGRGVGAALPPARAPSRQAAPHGKTPREDSEEPCSGEVMAGTPAGPGRLRAEAGRAGPLGHPEGSWRPERGCSGSEPRRAQAWAGWWGAQEGPFHQHCPRLLTGARGAGRLSKRSPRSWLGNGNPAGPPGTTSAVCRVHQGPARQLQLEARVRGAGDVLRPSVRPAAWWLS